MKKNKYQQAQEDIIIKIDEAKRKQNIRDKELAKRIDLVPGTISHMRYQQRLPCLPFWKVMEIASMAGYRLEFVKE